MHCEKLSRNRVVWRQRPTTSLLDGSVPALASRVGRLSSASLQVDTVYSYLFVPAGYFQQGTVSERLTAWATGAKSLTGSISLGFFFFLFNPLYANHHGTSLGSMSGTDH